MLFGEPMGDSRCGGEGISSVSCTVDMVWSEVASGSPSLPVTRLVLEALGLLHVTFSSGLRFHLGASFTGRVRRSSWLTARRSVDVCGLCKRTALAKAWPSCTDHDASGGDISVS